MVCRDFLYMGWGQHQNMDDYPKWTQPPEERIIHGKKYAKESGLKANKSGQAIFASRDFPKTYVDVREPLTLAVKPDSKQIEELDAKYSAELPDLDAVNNRHRPDTETTENQEENIDEAEDKTQIQRSESIPNSEEQKLLDFVKQYIREEDQTPTYSKYHREGPFGTKKTKDLLTRLIEKEKLEKEEVKRGGQETKAYKVI